MSTLTLTLDESFVEKVEKYAQRTGTHLSALFVTLMEPVLATERVRRPLSPKVKALLGCISLPPDYDCKDHLAAAIND